MTKRRQPLPQTNAPSSDPASDRALQEHFDLLIASAVDYVFITQDLDNRVTGWNIGAQRILGYTESEILGRSAAVFFTPEDRAKGDVERELHTALHEGCAAGERWHVRKDGSRFWGSSVMTLLRDAAGQPRGFATVLRDLTERKRAGRSEQLAALTASFITAQEDERRRIARELHDDLGERLAMLETGVVHLQQRLPKRPSAELDHLRQQVVKVYDQMRALSHGLFPAMLEDLGLEPALQALVEEFESAHSVPVTLISKPLPRRVLLPISTALYRISQEALGNVVKHAPGAQATVRLSDSDKRIHLSIEDDGPGFDPGTLPQHGGLGILSMAERARVVGGTLVLLAAPGAGTEILVYVPWPEGS